MSSINDFSKFDSLYKCLDSGIIPILNNLNFSYEQIDRIKTMLKSCSVFLSSIDLNIKKEAIDFINSYNHDNCIDIINNVSTISSMDLPLLSNGNNTYYDLIYSYLDDKIKYYSSPSYLENVITNFAIQYLSNFSAEEIQEQWNYFFDSFLFMPRYSESYNIVVNNLEKYFSVEIDHEKKVYDYTKDIVNDAFDNDILIAKSRLSDLESKLDSKLPSFINSINVIDVLYAKFVEISSTLKENGLSIYDDNLLSLALFDSFLDDLDNLEKAYESIRSKLINYNNTMLNKSSIYKKVFGKKYIKVLLSDDLATIESIKNKYEMLSLEKNMYDVAKIVLNYSVNASELRYEDIMTIIESEYEKIGLLFELNKQEQSELKSKYDSKRYSI